ncbi:uncharacterized protein LOC117411954 isoform X1 [Acipenser ruthenus]|uniref:uncharacterized protein LOC117411954 isoform X1 n=1 Tax=Acipenser ruthenus TaxID=7906 RepID=UPI00145BC69E|nr:uncharacterized protein LOC117411954 isoform X1 [Acipenser ruthenus]
MSAVKTIRPGGCSHAKNGEKDTDESGNKKQSESAECPDCDRSAEKRSDHIVCSVHLELPQSRRRKLILHLDLNNTILVSDAVTKQGTVAALDYFLSTATWGRVNRQGSWEWLSDLPSLLPPCQGAVTYYSQFGRVQDFTGTAEGQRFCGVLKEHLSLLEWRGEEDEELAVRGEDGRLYHWLLPAFFQLLQALKSQHREFCVVFRTFGTDLARVLGAVQRVLREGTHPLFTGLQALPMPLNPTPGRIRCSKKNVVLSRGSERVSTRGDERSLYRYFSDLQGLGGFQDHFDWWAHNSYSNLGGKPIWIDPSDPEVQHIFIDDNIRLNDEDSIITPKVFLGKTGTQTRTALTSELYDVNLIQTDLLRAISDHNYFSERIRICEENYEKYLNKEDG